MDAIAVHYIEAYGCGYNFDLMWILPCGQYDITELYWHDYLFFLVFESLGSAGNYSTLLRIVDLSVSKVENVMRIKEMDTDGKNIIPKNFDIEVENVDFYYDENHAEDAKIINHLSVHIPERTTTAIVGPSGGGKTTLCHLISRFWDVSNGNISLGGENVRNYSVDSLMKTLVSYFRMSICSRTPLQIIFVLGNLKRQ